MLRKNNSNFQKVAQASKPTAVALPAFNGYSSDYIFDNTSQAESFLQYLNSQRPNIAFTHEHEETNSLSFLGLSYTVPDSFLYQIAMTYPILFLLQYCGGYTVPDSFLYQIAMTYPILFLLQYCGGYTVPDSFLYQLAMTYPILFLLQYCGGYTVPDSFLYQITMTYPILFLLQYCGGYTVPDSF